MKERIGISIVLMIALATFVPPLFSEGMIFSVDGLVQDFSGEFVKTNQLYFDNVYFSLSFLVTSYFAICLPFILPKMHWIFAMISTGFGAWYFFGFLFEVFNFKIPSIVLNTSGDNAMYTKFVAAFAFGIIIIMIRDIWTSTMKQRK
ncbi:MAG: hypothetical protein ACI9JN_001293 [Bacteroidia bacterium]|jgi:hypothetical protein